MLFFGSMKSSQISLFSMARVVHTETRFHRSKVYYLVADRDDPSCSQTSLFDLDRSINSCKHSIKKYRIITKLYFLINFKVKIKKNNKLTCTCEICVYLKSCILCTCFPQYIPRYYMQFT